MNLYAFISISPNVVGPCIYEIAVLVMYDECVQTCSKQWAIFSQKGQRVRLIIALSCHNPTMMIIVAWWQGKISISWV